MINRTSIHFITMVENLLGKDNELVQKVREKIDFETIKTYRGGFSHPGRFLVIIQSQYIYFLPLLLELLSVL